MSMHISPSQVNSGPAASGIGKPCPTIEVAIETRGLRKIYPGGVRALDDLSFVVEAETIFGLLGSNDAGKSATFKILTALSRPDAAKARVAGFDVLSGPEWVRRQISGPRTRSGGDSEATGRENLIL